MVNFFITLIKCYQKVSHILLPNRCRYYPSCSQYAIDATQKYGIFVGFKKALGRILRCSPLSAGGYDPVQ